MLNQTEIDAAVMAAKSGSSESDVFTAFGLTPDEWIKEKLQHEILRAVFNYCYMKTDAEYIREQKEKKEREQQQLIEVGYTYKDGAKDHRALKRTDLGKRQSDADKEMVLRDFMSRRGMQWNNTPGGKFDKR